MGLISPPRWLPENVAYETVMGSAAYGVATDDSDRDIVGICIPPKEEVFPHLRGEVAGFGRQRRRFDQYQEHHILDASDHQGRGRRYDLTIYSIVKFFQLCMENNPNLVDTLYTPQTFVLHATSVAHMVRDHRDLFLHKGCWQKFRGYAYSQLHKMSVRTPAPGSKREASVQEFGYDVKFAYHVVRLVNEVEQILMEGTLDLQRSREQLKAIRRGEWSEAQVRAYLAGKERELESLYIRSPLRAQPDEAAIKRLLIDCLEEHYGSLAGAYVEPDAAWAALDEISAIVERTRRGRQDGREP